MIARTRTPTRIRIQRLLRVTIAWATSRGPPPARTSGRLSLSPAPPKLGPFGSAGGLLSPGRLPLEVVEGVLEGRDRDQREVAGHLPGLVVVALRDQERVRARFLRGEDLVLDAADDAHRARAVDGPGPGDGPAAGEVTRGHEVVQAEGPHQPRRGAADVAAGERQVEGEVRDRADPDEGAAILTARPPGEMQRVRVPAGPDLDGQGRGSGQAVQDAFERPLVGDVLIVHPDDEISWEQHAVGRASLSLSDGLHQDPLAVALRVAGEPRQHDDRRIDLALVHV